MDWKLEKFKSDPTPYLRSSKSEVLPILGPAMVETAACTLEDSSSAMLERS